MNMKRYEFDAVIKKVPNIDGAYVDFPYDVKKVINKQPGDIVHVTIQERE